MASVNIKNGKLFVDFRFQGKRRKEYTTLTDTKANRKRLEKVAVKIQDDIDKGVFNYAVYFPGSKMLRKLQQQTGLPVCNQALEPVQVQSGVVTPLFCEFAEIWMTQNLPLWRQTYIESLRSNLETHLKPWFGEKRVSEIIKGDILDFRAHLTKAKPGSPRVRSPATINRILKILRMILNEAADQHQFKSPSLGVKLLKEKKHHIEPFTLAEVRQILSVVRADYRTYFLVRFFTGMRSGEINGLMWKYVDFERNELLIRETFSAGRTEYTKNDGSQREIQMSAPVKQALLEHREVTGSAKYVFCNGAGEPLDNHNMVNRVWYPLLRLLDMKKRRPYETRHTCATLWLAAGEAPEWIARQLGHVNTMMLFQVYSRYVPNLTHHDGSAMDRLLADMEVSDVKQT